jgi:hypothetical protein
MVKVLYEASFWEFSLQSSDVLKVVFDYYLLLEKSVKKSLKRVKKTDLYNKHTQNRKNQQNNL